VAEVGKFDEAAYLAHYNKNREGIKGLLREFSND
jgi:hypothetical protein